MRDGRGETSLHLAARFMQESMVKLLLDMGKGKVDVKDDQGKTLLDITMEMGHRNVVDFLKRRFRHHG